MAVVSVASVLVAVVAVCAVVGVCREVRAGSPAEARAGEPRADFVCSLRPGKGKREKRVVIGAGSCNKAYLDQPAWQWMHDLDTFIFHGDVVYTRTSDVQALEAAFQQLEATPGFQAVNHSTADRLQCRATAENCVIQHGIWATWDDHDFGVNDGGGGEPLPGHRNLHLHERLRTFKEHMHPRCADTGIATLAGRNGTYHSVDIHVGGGEEPDQLSTSTVRISLLDTRTHRQLHAIPSLGSFGHIPVFGRLAPIIAAGSRVLAASLGWANNDWGAMLGEQQWTWLEHTLCDPAARNHTHIIVSSIQVLTSNPFVESWGHFPAERDRLLSLLARCRPQRVLLLSGDVHFTELISTDTGDLVELTTSGMTHTCVPGFACGAVIRHYHDHRSRHDAFHTDRAFAKIVLSWSEPMAKENATGAGTGDGKQGGAPHMQQQQRHQGQQREGEHGAKVAPVIVDKEHSGESLSVSVAVVASKDGSVLSLRERASLPNGTVYGDERNRIKWGVIHREPPVPKHHVVFGLLAGLGIPLLLTVVRLLRQLWAQQ